MTIARIKSRAAQTKTSSNRQRGYVCGTSEFALTSESRQRMAIEGWIKLFNERGFGDTDDTVASLQARRAVLDSYIKLDSR
jgi:hypothetical protein